MMCQISVSVRSRAMSQLSASSRHASWCAIVKSVKGKLTYVDVKQFPAEKVNPPEGVKSADWIKSGLKGSM